MKALRGLEALGIASVLVLLAPACGDDPKSSGMTGKAGQGNSAGNGTGGASSGGKAGGSSGKAGRGGQAGTSNVAGDAGEAGQATGGSGGGSGGGTSKGGRGGTSGTNGMAGDPGSGGEGGDAPVGPVRDPRCEDAMTSALQGSGTSQDPYLLCLPDQLALLDTGPYTLDQNYELGDDLDLDDLAIAFVTFSTPFTGTLDGRSHAITNLPAALFTSVAAPGEIVDLVVSGDVDASMQSTGWGLVTRSNSGTIRRVRASGTLAVGDHAGILLGTNSGLVEDCSSSGALTSIGAHVGGLAGVNTGTVRRSFSTASVSGGRRTGGLVGRQTQPGVIEESYALGAVTGITGTPSPGGLLGTFFGGTVRNCYARSPAVTGLEAGGLIGDISGAASDGENRVIVNSYSTSTVSGTGAEGLVGAVEGDPMITITSSYFLDTSGGTLGTALTDAELRLQASYTGWAFGSVWQMESEISPYPSLAFETP
jgi:hypothetical protein